MQSESTAPRSSDGPAAGGDARRVVRLVKGMAASDGAGVKLTRVIGQPQLDQLDPFLLLDEFGTDDPKDYIAGFPDHPHRGFETVTYMLDGRMRHRDNQGAEGLLVAGSVQWMTAGRGIVHSEMPEQEAGRMRGFQLWLNLPARDKMGPPKYQEYGPESIPRVTPCAGVGVKIIAGRVGDTAGPIAQPATDPLYLDVEIAAGASFLQAIPADHAAFVYAFEGAVAVGPRADARPVAAQELAVLGPGAGVRVLGIAPSSRALVVAARSLREPVARYGPFVMNTREEIMQAVADFQSGRF
jgi:redox-sensitive bicupin YhaK (pirin superfamily)